MMMMTKTVTMPMTDLQQEVDGDEHGKPIVIKIYDDDNDRFAIGNRS